ncbi:transcriptional activator mut3p [Fusarium sporotrichioides]|uniref:Transcriptional activator mut3p n=1 Tax=Fusarium sporotrichioides TaxID=5514 RepID=A0A395RJE0_FUSSP|nr:transcriptional activator mut3p [Fusarium sporotrichioides]
MTNTSHHCDTASLAAPSGQTSIMNRVKQDYPTYKILIIGGSYAGLSAAINLLDLQRGSQPRQSREPYMHQRQVPKHNIEITIIDERDGFYHLVGSPLALFDGEYAKKTWIKYQDIPEMHGPRIKHIHGAVTEVDCVEKKAVVVDRATKTKMIQPYDILVAASGLRRAWPIAPQAQTKEEFLSHIRLFTSSFGGASRGVVVVGGGAVGVEIAAKLKMRIPKLTVTLAHSRDTVLSSEPIPDSAKEKTLELLRDTGTLDGHHETHLEFNNGTQMVASKVINAISQSVPSTEYLPASALNPNGYVEVLPNMNLKPGTPNYQDHFSAGDIVQWPGIKRCSGAMHMGQLVAQNVHQRIIQKLTGKEPAMKDLEEFPPMIAVALAKSAVAYAPQTGVSWGDDVLQTYFGDDMALSCVIWGMYRQNMMGIPAVECIYLRDQSSRRNVTMPRHGGDSALVARIDRLEELLRQSVSSAGSEPRKLHTELDLEPEPEPEPEQVADLLSPESTLHQSATTWSSTPSDASLAQPYSIMPPVGVIVRSESGHERFEPASSQWSSIIQNNPVVIGMKTNMDENVSGLMPFSMVNSNTADLLEFLPPASYCEQLKKLYFDTFAPVSTPARYLLLTFQLIIVQLFHILHDPTFEMDYLRFQSDPEKVSLPWLALLFAILSIAVIALPPDSPLLRELGKRNSALDNMSLLGSRYRTGVMKCLEADHYLWRHNLNTLQAMVILIYGINHTHGQSWALLGVARNIALALGCHIEPTVFQMEPIRVEERRRCWAGLKMLYTIQNTTLGMLDATHLPSTVKPPLDINDNDIVVGCQIPQSRDGPTQMSYLLLKFELYDVCTRICSQMFETSRTLEYDKVLALDAEISAVREKLNYKYLFDVSIAAHHAVQLNILFGYTHQLTLLLHRPILRQGASGYTRENRLASQAKCIESSKELLGIHRALHENPSFYPYQWYNRGLGSFHAFHAAVCLAHIYMSGTNLDATTKNPFRELVRDSLQVFRYLMETGISAICTKATPILEKLLSIMNPQDSRDLSTRSDSMYYHPSSSHENDTELFDEYIENLALQQWLSPSNMGWEGWAMILEHGSMENVL